jgi:acyl carrier protein
MHQMTTREYDAIGQDDEAIRAMIYEALVHCCEDNEAMAGSLPPLTSLRESTSIDDLGLDSVSVLEFVGLLEERLGRQIAEEELGLLETFGDLVDLVRSR